MMTFFDKVKEGINRRVTTVGVKSREVLGTTLLKSQIDTLVKKKRNAVGDLGDAVYALFLTGVFDEDTLRKECMAVVSLEGQRLEKEEKLRRIRSRLYGAPGRPVPDEPCLAEDDVVDDEEFLSDNSEQRARAEKSESEGAARQARSPSHPLAEEPGAAGDAPFQKSSPQRSNEADGDQGAAAVAGVNGGAKGADGPAPRKETRKKWQPKGHDGETVVRPTCGTEYWLSAWFGEKEASSSEKVVESFLPDRKAPNPADPGSERHSELDPCPAPRMRLQKTPSGKRFRPISAAVILLICGAGGFLFYTGYTARSPMAIEAQLNDRLGARGLNVTAVIAKDRTAVITGSVPSREEKELAIALVKSHRLVRRVSDEVVAEDDMAALKEKLSGVVQDMVALKNAIVTRYAADKGVPKAADAPMIGRIYRIGLPETYAAFSIMEDGTIRTTIRNIAGEVNDKTVQLKPSPDLTVWRWASNIDETYLPFRKGDEIKEVIPSTPAPKPPRPVVVHKPKRTRPPKPVMQVLAKPQPPALPAPPVVPVDSATLEGEINRSLRNAGIKGVIAEVGDGNGAVLKGTATSAPDKQKAFEITRGVKGVRDVKDIVFVIEQ